MQVGCFDILDGYTEHTGGKCFCSSPLTAFEVSEAGVGGGVRTSFSFTVDVPFMTRVPVDRRVRILTPTEVTGVSASNKRLKMLQFVTEMLAPLLDYLPSANL